jgi:hypothetical protein
MDEKTLKYLEELQNPEKCEFVLPSVQVKAREPFSKDKSSAPISELPLFQPIHEVIDRNVHFTPVGAVPDDLRKSVFERDGYKCVKCDATDYLECDHAKPRAKGGLNELSNLQTLCRRCNSEKGVTEWYGPTLNVEVN